MSETLKRPNGTFLQGLEVVETDDWNPSRCTIRCSVHYRVQRVVEHAPECSNMLPASGVARPAETRPGETETQTETDDDSEIGTCTDDDVETGTHETGTDGTSHTPFITPNTEEAPIATD